MFRAVSKFDRGVNAFERGDWKGARRLLARAIEEDPRAIGFYYLGLLYWRGLGGAADKTAAGDCFARASASAYPAAQTAYGIALRSGVGVALDEQAAAAQFRRAAGAGDREAMLQLSTMSTPDDARRWLNRAAELGYPRAMMALSDTLMAADPVEALSWLCATVRLTAHEPARKRAAALAKQMTAPEIAAAQKAGLVRAKELRDRARGR